MDEKGLKIKKPLTVHKLVKLLSFTAFIAVIAIVLTIFVIVFFKSERQINFSFLTDRPKGTPIGSQGGIFPAIVGSLYFTLTACVFATILSLVIAIYLKFYCTKEKYMKMLRIVIGIIGGIPSIILGLFGYSFLVVHLNFGISILSGGLVLGIMIFPYMEIKFEQIFHDIDQAYKTNVYSLGVNTYYYIFHLVIPLAWRDIVSTISLMSSMAMGASAPLLLTGAVFYSKAPKSILSPAMALPLHLYHLVSESISIENAFATAGVLLIILILLNMVTWLLSYWGEEKWM